MVFIGYGISEPCPEFGLCRKSGHFRAMSGIWLVPEVWPSTTFFLKKLKDENRCTHKGPVFLA
jgi:hypothetical protein